MRVNDLYPGSVVRTLMEAVALETAGLYAQMETVYRAGFLDARVDALIPMAPGAVVVFGQGGADIALPPLLITAARDATTSTLRDLGKALRDHDQLTTTLLPVSDGLLVAVKR